MADQLAQALQASADEETGGSKRKRDGNGTQTRAKRNRYISIACNECKRRKIKCNGETPCQRCGNLNLECLYAPNCCSSNFKDSNEYRQLNDQVASLQNQVDSLVQNLNTLRSSLGQDVYVPDNGFYNDQERSLSAPQASMVIDPALQGRDRHTSPKHPHFQGPTSNEFSLGLARSSLRSMGITTDESMEEGLLVAASLAGSPTNARAVPSNKDPIWSLSKDEALRLIRVFDDENGQMYPILDIKQVTQHATLLFTFVDAMSQHMSLTKHLPGSDAIQDPETDILKLVLALAMVTEGVGSGELSKRLVQSVSRTAENRLLGNVGLKDLQILTLIAMYYFHTDDEVMSWRVIGLTARLCIELGLHRSETYDKNFAQEEERTAAVMLFWSIYVLDRRWSFGTGMSFALQDADLDSNIPKPEESPYLSAMISYSKIAAKVWKSANSADSANNVFSKDDLSYLDFQVIQWQRDIPESLRYIHPNSAEFAQHSSDPNAASGRPDHRLRLILYLRANQMRISIYHPVLRSPTSILSTASSNFAQTVTDIAKDTIRVLTHVNQTSDIYRAQQITFNYFLLSALTVLLTAVSKSPAQYSEPCRDEFYMALDLVRGLSATSSVSKRLWELIRFVKDVGPKLGMYKPGSPDDQARKASLNNGTAPPAKRQAARAPVQHDAHSSAAVAMAGLAGHPIDESILFTSESGYGGRGDKGGSPLAAVTSPNVMANELTSMFEAAGGYAGFAGATAAGATADAFEGGAGGLVAAAGGGATGVPGLDAGFGLGGWANDEEFSRIMRDLY